MMKKIETTAQVVDTNNRTIGAQSIALEIYADSILSTLTVGDVKYHATGKSGTSNGHPGAAPAGTTMFEMEGAGSRRAWVDLAGAYVHLD